MRMEHYEEASVCCMLQIADRRVRSGLQGVAGPGHLSSDEASSREGSDGGFRWAAGGWNPWTLLEG